MISPLELNYQFHNGWQIFLSNLNGVNWNYLLFYTKIHYKLHLEAK